MKQDQQSLESDRAANRILLLTTALHNAAKEVVKAFDAFDWDELRNSESDVVYLNFEDHDGLQRADDLLHQLCITYPTLIASVSQRCLRRFKGVRQYAQAYIDFLQVQIRENSLDQAALAGSSGKLEELKTNDQRLGCLEIDFKRSINSLEFQAFPYNVLEYFSIWKKARAIIDELEKVRVIVTEDKPKDREPKDRKPTTIAPPPPIPPLRIGNLGERWFSLPLSLLAGTFVAFSRKIAHVNTGRAHIPMDAFVIIYFDLFTQCGLLGLEIPSEDAVSSFKASELQKMTDRLAKAMHAFLNEVAEQATVKEAPEPPQVQAMATSAKCGDLQAAEVPDAAAEPVQLQSNGSVVCDVPARDIPAGIASIVHEAQQKGALEESPVNPSAEQLQANDPAHEITIDDKFVVMVDARQEMGDQNRRTLLGLAIYAHESDSRGFRVNSREFLKKVEGPERHWSKRWNARCQALQGSVLFCAGDITNWDSFIQKLKTHSDAADKYLWCRFPKRVREQISGYKTDSDSRVQKRLQKDLLLFLNKLVQGPLVSVDSKSPGARLSVETPAPVQKELQVPERTFQNRVLLRAACPMLTMDRPTFSRFRTSYVTDGEYDICGLRIVAKPQPAEIENYLAQHPFKTRGRRTQAEVT